MRFSVIIPTFKRAQLLGDAIRAALAQTHTNREILVVDDGSPDDTRSIVSTFGVPSMRRRWNEILTRIFPLAGLSDFAATGCRHRLTYGTRNLFRRKIPAGWSSS